MLSLAAIGLGARQVFAVDIDSLAVRATIANAEINAIDFCRLKVAQGSVDILQSELKTQKVDLLLCNILASVIESLAPEFDQLISSHGHGVFSGLLKNQAFGLIEVFKALGWATISSTEKDRWVMLRVGRR